MERKYFYYQEKKSILYFFKTEEKNIIKIGVSLDLNTCAKRFRILNGLCPYRLSRSFCYFERKDTRKLEKFLHRYLKKYRLNGEWFEVTDQIVNRIENFKKIKKFNVVKYKKRLTKKKK